MNALSPSEILPTTQEWRALFEAALEFKGVEPWRWMYDSNLFGVKNPESDETGYCCVLGNLGQVFGLAVYLGTDGLEGYIRMQSGDLLPDEALHHQKCLMASFENRNELQQRDLKLIKDLGLKFRGRNAWPAFRSYLPGYYPWFLTGTEARFLTSALLQSIEVALHFEEDKNLLDSSDEEAYLVRVLENTGDASRWEDRWLKPEPLKKESLSVNPLDDVRLQKIKRSCSVRPAVWETDLFYAPGPVQEKGRPYFPYVVLWADHSSYSILGSNVLRPWNYLSEYQEGFFELVEAAKFLPAEIWVEKEELFALLAPIADKLGIALKKGKRLNAVEAAREAMRQFMR